ncbi:BlaI/MecI/CopY family transcriptional regulator [Actinocrinis puniceicyclus]|uniref:BlaI/MecI/CopY family transcriptional regulator n=1 Tax=Actinocrinis puniceicyclus TaxID=977794 RepID=A0A8J8BGM3_9ACTN|nr:BlaI/MecI/CopY family transcriptional regulator [Actinocrinis puniceicyclus]MBS2965919.1 BlaI/MecI/CopY family transcriptional regulator [Actinocrinis puniceicyclus]
MAALRKPQRNKAPRRASGALESAVLAVLWEAGQPLSATDVRERLLAHDGGSADLAYTTVVTILTRLHEKNALYRQREGRAYRYAPVADEAGLAARRLSALLDATADRNAVLSSFVNDLSDADEQLLRALLGARTHGTSHPARG